MKVMVEPLIGAKNKSGPPVNDDSKSTPAPLLFDLVHSLDSSGIIGRGFIIIPDNETAANQSFTRYGILVMPPAEKLFDRDKGVVAEY